MTIKSFFGWTLAVLLVLALIGVALIKLLLPPQKVVDILIPQMEQALDRQVKYGDADVSLFPGIGVTIKDIQVKNDPGFVREDFLRIDRLACRLKLMPLLRGDVEFAQVEIDNPELYLIRKPDGICNYSKRQRDIQAPGDEQALAALFAFKELSIDGGRIIHRDDSTSIKWVIGGIDFQSRQSGVEDLTVIGTMEADSLGFLTEVDDFIIYPADFSVDFALDYFPYADSLLIEKCDIDLAGLEAAIEGRVQHASESPDVDLSLVAPGVRLRELQDTRLLSVISVLEEIDLGGQMRLDVTYKGRIDEPDADKLRGKLTLVDLLVRPQRLDTDFRADLAELNFNSQSVSFFTEGAQVGETPASFRLAIDDFDDPNISAELDLTSKLAFLAQFFDPDPESRFLGTAEVSVSGFMRWQDRENLRLMGTMKLNDASISSPRLRTPIQELDFSCQFLGKDLLLESLHLRSDRTELDLTGRLLNVSSYFATLGHSIRRPLLDFELHSDFLDIGAAAGVTPADSESDSMALPLFAFLPDLDASGHIDIDRGQIGDVELRHLKSRLLVLNRIVQIDSTTCDVFEGRAEGDLLLDLSDSQGAEWECDLRAYDVEVGDLLSALTDYPLQLRGRADMIAGFQGASPRDSAASFNGSGSVLIGNGKLEDIEPLNVIADRLGFEAIAKEDFRDFKCRFEVADRELRIDELSMVQSRLENLVAGTIGFDGALDLTLRTSLPESEVKHLLFPEEFRRLLSDWGGADLAFLISGTAEQLGIVLDVLEARKPGREDQSETLRKLINDLL